MDACDLELLVDRAATEAALPPQFFPAFRLLARELEAHSGRWGLFLLKYEHRDDLNAVSQAIQLLVKRMVRIQAMPYADWPSLEAALTEAAASADLIELADLDAWLDPHPEPRRALGRMHAWNVRRDGFAHAVAAPVVCWMRPATLRQFATAAPDLWSWRAGVHDFVLLRDASMHEHEARIQPHHGLIDSRTVGQKTQRIHEIQQYLDDNPEPALSALPLHGSLLDELAKLKLGLGQVDEALCILREKQLPIFEKLGDVRSSTITLGKIANILEACGEFDEALRIHREEELPVYEKLGDIRLLAFTHGKIADILQARGEFDEALRIYHNEQLPVFEKLGDVRSRAITQGRIADILEACGEFDEALRIRREEELPVYEKLGDVRERAIAQGKIADILQQRGEFDEALRIYCEEELPVYEKLGDVRERAITQSQIADILQARGEVEEALRIYREDALPVFEKLGDKRSLVILQARIADLLQARSKSDEAQRLRRDQ